MYNVLDYLVTGGAFVKNITVPTDKTLSSLMLYSTSLCQSRCKHCSIWKKPIEHLSLSDIIRIMSSKCITKRTTVGLEGGEFILHPEADAILNWFHNNHTNYTLLSNCLAPSKVIEAVKKYKPKHLYISLDGNKETYKTLRGRDGYDKVIQVVESCKDFVPISFMFCLTPWNTFEDMDYVIQLAKHYNIDVRIGIYNTMDFFDTTEDLMEVGNDYIKKIPQSIHETQENFDFVALYDEWKKGNLRLRCHSIYNELVIHSNGNVPLCQNLDVILGNVHNNTLDEIFNSQRTAKIQCEYSHDCNKCWINYHRKFDIILLRAAERFFPKKLIEAFYGKYQWTADEKCTYRKYFKGLI